jgi:plasmid stabilization system protein ParE
VTRRVNFRPQAEAETLAAREWYEARHAGLGHEFAKDVERAVGLISDSPNVFPKVHADVRRVVLKRFPYAIYFRALRDEVLILAVIHGRRHPGRWKSRR